MMARRVNALRNWCARRFSELRTSVIGCVPHPVKVEMDVMVAHPDKVAGPVADLFWCYGMTDACLLVLN